MSEDAHVAMVFFVFLLILDFWCASLLRVEKEGAKTRAKLVKQLEDTHWTLAPSSMLFHVTVHFQSLCIII